MTFKGFQTAYLKNHLLNTPEKMPTTSEYLIKTSVHVIFRGFHGAKTSVLLMNTSLTPVFRGFHGAITSEYLVHTAELGMHTGYHRMNMKNLLIYDEINCTKTGFQS